MIVHCAERVVSNVSRQCPVRKTGSRFLLDHVKAAASTAFAKALVFFNSRGSLAVPSPDCTHVPFDINHEGILISSR